MVAKGVAKEGKCKVRVNAVITGEPAEWLIKWKRRGLITSYTDGIIQALKALNEKMTEQDLKLIQLKNLRNEEDL
jgi:hypothetical protein